ncbi:hypothetical protein CIB95_09805 [Lottiidibacillus patelloidae]|uniref:DUF2642 domain-containing protein n=2 Tax=Lottiidibacillus patelloidae TaxID=2670334 RepID=A0A263BTN9_9BACI|nr:hypothetical protein CIB95_09805 [Lottiidibacillus patelloidae]
MKKDINAIQSEALIQHFIDGIGRKVFILMPGFPFMFIGEILDVVGDVAKIHIETTQTAVLEDRNWLVHIHSIEVFYIERDGGPKIPELRD